MKKRTVFFLVGVLFLLAALFFLGRAALNAYAPEQVLSESFTPAPVTASPSPTPTEAPEPTEPSATETPEPTPTPYVSPVDFDSLSALNSDIYGWLELPNTGISLPILQDAENDAFYLNHNSDRAYSANGSVFSEATYNSKSFDDPVTLLYGHHMKDGAIFGNLQYYYSDSEFFEENPTFTIYTPEEELTYGVFAAIPYPGDHILYYNDFTDEDTFHSFFELVFNIHDFSANFNRDYAPEFGDRVVILSTCLIGNNTNRFLVMGRLLP